MIVVKALPASGEKPPNAGSVHCTGIYRVVNLSGESCDVAVAVKASARAAARQTFMLPKPDCEDELLRCR